MRLKFKTIQIHNFMSFGDEVFDYSSLSGLTLIKGINHDALNDANGCGKTCMWNALIYTLFGQVQDLKNQSLVNRNADDKDMRLVLDLTSNDNEYKIIRGLNRGKSSYLQVFSVKGDDEAELTKSTISETQTFIEHDILDCDLSIFLRTMILSATQSDNFYTMKQADKKEFVEKLFDISIFGDIYQAIHKDILALDKSILASQNQLLVLNKNMADYTDRKNRFDAERIAKLKNLKEIVGKLVSEKNELMSREVKNNSDAIKKLSDAKTKLVDAIDKLRSDKTDVDGKLAKIDVAQHKLDASRESKEKIIARHSELLSKLCSDCKSIFSDYYDLTTIQNDIVKIDSDSSKLQDKRKSLSDALQGIAKKIKAYSDKMSTIDTKLHDLTDESVRVSKSVMLIESKISSTETDITNAEKSKNPYDDMLLDTKTEIDNINSRLAEMDAKSKYLKFAEGIVSQETLRKFIIKDLLALLNNRVRYYLTKLGADYRVLFNEDMDYEFIDSNGSTFEFGNFSGGERMRTMMATSFAFRDFMSIRNGLVSNILVLDEYFDSAISSQCVENLVTMLKEFNEMNDNIYVISHRAEVNPDSFDHILQVEKSRGFSSLKTIS